RLVERAVDGTDAADRQSRVVGDRARRLVSRVLDAPPRARPSVDSRARRPPVELEHGRARDAMGPRPARPQRRVRLHGGDPRAAARSAGPWNRWLRAIFLRALDPARGHARRGAGLYAADARLCATGTWRSRGRSPWRSVVR